MLTDAATPQALYTDMLAAPNGRRMSTNNTSVPRRLLRLNRNAPQITAGSFRGFGDPSRLTALTYIDSVRAGSLDNGKCSAAQNLEVVEQRPVLYVTQVKAN